MASSLAKLQPSLRRPRSGFAIQGHHPIRPVVARFPANDNRAPLSRRLGSYLVPLLALAVGLGALKWLIG